MFATEVYALHGFLGKATDFDCFKELSLKAVDVFKYSGLNLKGFAASFNDRVPDDSILLGYSMGGRLALNALIDSPKKWKAAIIISTHLGYTCNLEKKERLKNDALLLERYETEDFETFMHKWNDQPLFLGHQMKRKKEDYSKKDIEQCLTKWSLGTQEDLQEAVSKLPMPIFWITGELDQKYKQDALKLQFLNPKSRIWIAKNAAHRVPWELKEEFQREVKVYIEGL